MKTRKILFITLGLLLCTSLFAQNAKSVLDKTAAIVGRKGGAAANFAINSQHYGNISGTIAIKGNKFKAVTPQSTVWYDGKTQWAYMKGTNEVNISTPNEAQRLSMNPYTFLSIYKNGYNLSMKTGANYQIHLKAIQPARSVQELYITITKRYQPQQIKMLQGGKWITIKISNFKAINQSDNLFRYNAKETKGAEVIDLR